MSCELELLSGRPLDLPVRCERESVVVVWPVAPEVCLNKGECDESHRSRSAPHLCRRSRPGDRNARLGSQGSSKLGQMFKRQKPFGGAPVQTALKKPFTYIRRNEKGYFQNKRDAARAL